MAQIITMHPYRRASNNTWHKIESRNLKGATNYASFLIMRGSVMFQFFVNFSLMSRSCECHFLSLKRICIFDLYKSDGGRPHRLIRVSILNSITSADQKHVLKHMQFNFWQLCFPKFWTPLTPNNLFQNLSSAIFLFFATLTV